MGVTRQALSKAVTEQRMSCLNSVAGKKLYPAFCAAPTLNRRQFGKISKVLPSRAWRSTATAQAMPYGKESTPTSSPQRQRSARHDVATSRLKPPPTVLATSVTLPVVGLPVPGLYRISGHASGEPYFGASGGNRFDAPSCRTGHPEYGTCYPGLSFEVALAESLLHDAAPVKGAFPIANDRHGTPSKSISHMHGTIAQA